MGRTAGGGAVTGLLPGEYCGRRHGKGAGTAGGVILLTAVPLHRLRAVVSTCLQMLVAVSVVLVAAASHH
ncbi:hypothetical protein ACWCRD_19855 [Streptomyces sp. NPDC002092]